MDVVSPATRSRMMAGIRARNTRPEMLVRRLLFASGFRFRLHRRDLPGAPEVVLPKHRLAVFVHGCFWHQHEGCPLTKMPGSNRDFWKEKLGRNQRRDRENVDKLVAAGWCVLVVWECATRLAPLATTLERDLVAAVRAADASAVLPRQPLQTSSICTISRSARLSC